MNNLLSSTLKVNTTSYNKMETPPFPFREKTTTHFDRNTPYTLPNFTTYNTSINSHTANILLHQHCLRTKNHRCEKHTTQHPSIHLLFASFFVTHYSSCDNNNLQNSSHFPSSFNHLVCNTTCVVSLQTTLKTPHTKLLHSFQTSMISHPCAIHNHK